ncbi:hypothetical protein E2I00_019949 [Balaenoptera physalus]|uniref:SH3 domain-binding glutamic acid-rich-like protein n=1 Tax=Balaenoptera physalus TaxID=9770 RepID=A0A6A1QCD6_BALPH|nr:hypothetical protein E2I00_019949 [Balaenoptera physalus]
MSNCRDSVVLALLVNNRTLTTETISDRAGGSRIPAILPDRSSVPGERVVVRVFIASSSGFVAIKKQQQDVVRFLEANKIESEEVDLTMSEEQRQWMYKTIPPEKKPARGNPLPPQIFNGD